MSFEVVRMDVDQARDQEIAFEIRRGRDAAKSCAHPGDPVADDMHTAPKHRVSYDDAGIGENCFA